MAWYGMAQHSIAHLSMAQQLAKGSMLEVMLHASAGAEQQFRNA